MTRRGTGRGKGKGKGSKDAKAKARVKAKKKATRQAGSKRKAPKREQFDKNKEGHPEEADRQIEIARAAPHNLDTQPDICAFITDETKKLDQKPLFYGEGTKQKTLANYIRQKLKETGGTVLPSTGGVEAWHRETHFGECECEEIVDVMVHDDGEDASDAVEPERVMCFRSLLG